MNYSNMTKEDLILRIEELELLNQQLLQEKEHEDRLDYAWTGNLGHWYWNVITNNVTFNILKAQALGYSKDEIPESVPYSFFTDKLHPEDYQKTMDAMLDHLKGKSNVYEVEYRIRTKDGHYKWYYDRGSITKKDENGKPVFLAGIVFDLTEKKQMQMDLEIKNKLLQQQSLKDGLTNVYNRRGLIAHLSNEMQLAISLQQPLSIAMFDIDNFKKINDTKGHLFGDQVLIEVAKLMGKNSRELDFVGRYGGEEFMIIFKNTSYDKAKVISERIRKAIEKLDYSDVQVTISGGIKEYHGEKMSELINAADVSLYEAKAKGKNRIV